MCRPNERIPFSHSREFSPEDDQRRAVAVPDAHRTSSASQFRALTLLFAGDTISAGSLSLE